MKGFLQFLGTFRLIELFITISFGEAIKKFWKVAEANISSSPIVQHYLNYHEGRFHNCEQCKLPTKVDAISNY